MAKTRVFRGFSVQINGLDYRTRAEEIEVADPKFKKAGLEAGYSGYVPIELVYIEEMEAKIKVNDVPEDVYLSFGLARGRIATVIATAAIQAQGQEPVQVLVVLQGIVNNLPGLNAKAGDFKSGAFTMEMSLQRYSLTVNKVPIINVDNENNLVFIGGFDHYAAIRDTLMI